MDFNYNILLEYLSYKKYGKWTDFKKYVNDLNYETQEKPIKPNVVRRILSSLAHCEFLFSENSKEYAVTPCVISLLPDSAKGVLCGYRTQEFLKKIQDKCRELNLSYNVLENNNAPDLITVDFKDLSNLKIYQEYFLDIDVKIIQDFSKKILYTYPSIDEIVKNAPVEMDIGKIDEVYSEIYHKFTKESPKDYYTCKKKNFGIEKYYLFRQKEDETKYILLDKYSAICKQYSVFKNNIAVLKNKTLYIKYLEGLPELIDRALTLASGYNRRKLKQYIVYDNISLELAKLFCKKSGLSLEVKND